MELTVQTEETPHKTYETELLVCLLFYLKKMVVGKCVTKMFGVNVFLFTLSLKFF